MAELAALDPALQLALRLGLALVFLRAAAHKLRDPEGFQVSLSEYRLLPEALSASVARGVPLVECSIALALLLPGGLGIVGALAMLVTYTLAIGINLARGRRHIDCGCGGPAEGQPLSAGLVLRNVGLIVLALLGGLTAEPRALLWLDAVTIAGLGGAIALLHAATDVALANARRLRDGSAAW